MHGQVHLEVLELGLALLRRQHVNREAALLRLLGALVVLLEALLKAGDEAVKHREEVKRLGGLGALVERLAHAVVRHGHELELLRDARHYFCFLFVVW